LVVKSLFIVDDHDIVRFGLETLIKHNLQFKLCGTASTLASALEAVAKLKPDLLVTDMSLPDSQGLGTVRALVQAQSPRPLVVLSMHDELIYAEQVLNLGAQGYLMKEHAHALLMQVAQAVLAGERWVSPKVSEQLLNRLLARRNRSDGSLETPKLQASMSMREVQVLEKIGTGKTTKEIAFSLSLSPRTVDVHRANIKKKLNLRSGTELVAYAVSRL
jgi:DNA-binding NarL/FixJ family response regulator